ncbi:hypothetical protein [Caulobacter sp. UC70_42]|uniref:hypothetical protein n=1 Tax=Caulobacter sp. UC70_42 TaxID=3374551 RepID=UPI003757EC6B
MAVIARAEALASIFEAGPINFGPQVWLDPKHGLVAGVFPSPTARFDFASEKAVTLSGEPGESVAGSAGLKRIVSLLHEAKRVGQICEIETSNAIYRLGSATQMLVYGLDLIEAARPGTMEKLSARKKQSKRPVAKTRAALYDVEHPDSHSTQLKCGWYVGTNNKAAEARGVLRQAVELAGLVWGQDFVVRR